MREAGIGLLLAGGAAAAFVAQPRRENVTAEIVLDVAPGNYWNPIASAIWSGATLLALSYYK